MLIVDYQSKSYHRFLGDMNQIVNHKKRFLITFNGADEAQLAAATAELTAVTGNAVQPTASVIDKAPEAAVSALFEVARQSRDLLRFDHADLLFIKKTEVKKSHERDNGFNINHLFKSIAKHNGVIILATQAKQTLSATMSTKVDVVIRFPSETR